MEKGHEYTQLVEEVIDRLMRLLSMDLCERPELEARIIAGGLASDKMSAKIELETHPFVFRMLIIGETGETAVLRELSDPSRKLQFHFPGDHKAN